MIASGPTFREAHPEDVPDLSRVRLAVTENAMTAEQLAGYGITNESIAESFRTTANGWVAEVDGRIVAFSIADRANRSVFALFVQPGFERRGIGTRLLAIAMQWLRDNGVAQVWLTTAPGTRAARFYARHGWRRAGTMPNGELRFEIDQRV